jgi:hypothetical protein
MELQGQRRPHFGGDAFYLDVHDLKSACNVSEAGKHPASLDGATS